MPRTARTALEGVPYHLTQRGNRQQQVFFNDQDRHTYLSWLQEYSQKYDLEILGYCLMSNHIHLVVLPHCADGMANTLRILHTRYSQMINARFRWSGHLWQGRFFSTALDDAHLWAAVRYVEGNPVRAGLVKKAEDYRWSSAASHLGLAQNELLKGGTMWSTAVEGWQLELERLEDEDVLEMIRARTHSGFPCGNEEFVQQISKSLNRPLVLRPRGRPRKG